METLKTINFVIAVIFFVCYTYQFLYIPVPWLRKARPHGPAKDNRYAVLICARNEQRVIGDLIASLRGQTYPQGLLSLFVLEHLEQDYPQGFDGYFVFDADNILAPNYVEAMNRTFSDGHDIVTSYRNSKNYGDNWISAGYALWFLRESRYLNHARFLLGTSCAVSGTGFLVSRRVLEETGPWPFHLLTEDIQFSVDQVTRGRKIAFCPDAVLYDEQPTTFRQSWNQRLRWSKGYLQVFRGYGARLLRGAARGSFSCYDMAAAIMPAFVLSATAIVCNVTAAILGAVHGEDLTIALWSVGQMLLNMYLTLFVLGAITTVTEWKRIHTKAVKKILYAFTFPLFMFTYIPISFAALFSKGEWKPIEHRVSAASLRGRGREELLPF